MGFIRDVGKATLGVVPRLLLDRNKDKAKPQPSFVSEGYQGVPKRTLINRPPHAY